MLKLSNLVHVTASFALLLQMQHIITDSRIHIRICTYAFRGTEITFHTESTESECLSSTSHECVRAARALNVMSFSSLRLKSGVAYTYELILR